MTPLPCENKIEFALKASRTKTCNDAGTGFNYGACTLAECDGGYHLAENNSCAINVCTPHQEETDVTCTPSEGSVVGVLRATLSRTCDATGAGFSATSECSVVACHDSSYYLKDGICKEHSCVPNEQRLAVACGDPANFADGVQSMTRAEICNSEGSGFTEVPTCTVASCDPNSHYLKDGTCQVYSCVPNETQQNVACGNQVNYPVGVISMTQAETCNSEGSGFAEVSNCKVASCDPNSHYLKDGTCQVHSCVPNEIQQNVACGNQENYPVGVKSMTREETCNAEGSALSEYSSCSIASCDESSFYQRGESCLPKVCKSNSTEKYACANANDFTLGVLDMKSTKTCNAEGSDFISKSSCVASLCSPGYEIINESCVLRGVVVNKLDSANTSMALIGYEPLKIGTREYGYTQFGLDSNGDRQANQYYSFSDLQLVKGQRLVLYTNYYARNIFIRITGGVESVIDGTIEISQSTTNNANLWIINPAGIKFKANASFVIPKSLHISTASELEFEPSRNDAADQYFTVNKDYSTRQLLSFKNPLGLDFNDQDHKDITFEGSQIKLRRNADISLLARNVIFGNSKLIVPAGRIMVLATVSASHWDLRSRSASSNTSDGLPFGGLRAGTGNSSLHQYGTVNLKNYISDDADQKLPEIDFDPTTNDTRSGLDVTGGRGLIQILSHQSEMRFVRLAAGTLGQRSGGLIDIRSTGKLQLSRSLIAADTNGSGRSGDITIVAGNKPLLSSDSDSDSDGTGNVLINHGSVLSASIRYAGEDGRHGSFAGKINIYSESLTLTGEDTKIEALIQTRSAGLVDGISANPGYVRINSNSFIMTDSAGISTEARYTGTPNICINGCPFFLLGGNIGIGGPRGTKSGVLDRSKSVFIEKSYLSVLTSDHAYSGSVSIRSESLLLDTVTFFLGSYDPQEYILIFDINGSSQIGNVRYTYQFPN